VHQSTFVAVAVSMYFVARVIVEGSRESAAANAARIVRFERWLGIDVERRLQALTIDNALLRAIGNATYVWLHWPLLMIALVFVYRRDTERYLQLRDALVWSGAVGVAFFAVFPVAPPRFMPGFAGTVSESARRAYLPIPVDWANQFASFPSFHAGWTFIACVAMASVAASPWTRALVRAPAALMAVSVMTTGNHYVLDVVGGTAIALAAFVVAGRHRRSAAG
jgi:membrane-associated phospholipid phosphatase